ncbi:MAG: hypothetical protein AAFX56_05055 [Pseudomonadota bacterium]
MERFDWFFDTFGWVFNLTPAGWFYLFLGVIAARIVFGLLWQIFFPESYRARKEKLRLARAESESDI